MIRLRQIKIDVNAIQDIKRECLKKLKIKDSDILKLKINKKSLDARKKPQLFYIYEVDISVKDEDKILKRNNNSDIFKRPNEEYKFEITGMKEMKYNPIIVGSGPAGLFCGYMLALYGYKPIIIERGEDIDSRVKTVEEFFENGKLNSESNVQFGEGGAGTFSDGKLNTLVKDPFFRNKKVLEIFVSCGAPKEILYLNKPHIGTDLLREVIKNLRNKIISLGGIIKYNTCLTNILVEDNCITGIEVNNQEIMKCDNLILALGHSARDTFKMLYEKNVVMEPKPFAVGIRIQHPQSLIDENQYGKNNHLPAASYKLTYKASNGRGVYSFCMCPGGYVVNASSEEGMLAINGMSNHLRDSKNANSAIVVTVTPKDFGNNPLDGINYQRKLEKNAYMYGLGKIPTQLYKDFMDNKKSTKLGIVDPIFKGKYQLTNLNDILPDYIVSSLKEGIKYFGKRIKGFDADDTILSAVESRTSSPIRINRDLSFQSNIKGVYPCGEGAGYAGGIMSAAMDGIKVAEMLAKEYKK